MATARYAVWVLEIITAWAILFAIQIPLRKRQHRVINTAVFLIKVLLILLTALMFVAFVIPFTYNHSDIITAVYLALAGDVAASVVEIYDTQDPSYGERKERKSGVLVEVDRRAESGFLPVFLLIRHRKCR